MSPEMLLLVAVVLFAVAAAVVFYALKGGAATGVAQSLTLIELQVSAQEVGRNELPARERLLLPILNATKGLGSKLSQGGATERITRLLDLAGNPPGWTTDRVLGAKGAGLLAGSLLGLFFGGLSLRGLLFAAAGAAAGFFLPDLLVYNQGAKRQQDLQRGLAEALDMLTVCVEAGLSFDGALMQVARSVSGPIAGEFTRVLSEIQIGKGRGQAFRSLADRTKVPEIKTFVTALVQADRLGLPLGSVLREQAKEMRVVRRQKAEEKAQKVPVKILFPMLLFIFPALFIVIIGPAAIRMVNVFSHM